MCIYSILFYSTRMYVILTVIVNQMYVTLYNREDCTHKRKYTQAHMCLLILYLKQIIELSFKYLYIMSVFYSSPMWRAAWNAEYLCSEVKVRFSLSTLISKANKLEQKERNDKKKRTHTCKQSIWLFDMGFSILGCVCVCEKRFDGVDLISGKKLREENKTQGKHCQSVWGQKWHTTLSLFYFDFGCDIKTKRMIFKTFKSYIRI